MKYITGPTKYINFFVYLEIGYFLSAAMDGKIFAVKFLRWVVDFHNQKKKSDHGRLGKWKVDSLLKKKFFTSSISIKKLKIQRKGSRHTVSFWSMGDRMFD